MKTDRLREEFPEVDEALHEVVSHADRLLALVRDLSAFVERFTEELET